MRVKLRVKVESLHESNRHMPRVLLLIPSYVDADTAELAVQGCRPQTDYHALQLRLGADILDYSALERTGLPASVRIARRLGRAAGLAALGYVQASDYDIIFTNAENVGIPFALLLQLAEILGRRPSVGHVMIGHRLSSCKKRWLLRGVRSQIDAVFVYSAWQRDFGISRLGFAESKLIHIPFHADHQFFRPQHPSPESNCTPPLISSAGMEWRDYSTLMRAVNGMDVEVRIGAYSPWSRSRRRNNWRSEKPRNVSMRHYNYAELRELYEKSSLVVVPVLQTDFQAGITTIIEAMSLGKALIATRTMGMADTLRNGENALLVPPGDAEAMRKSIELLINDPTLATRLGAQARSDVESSLTLDHWVDRITKVIWAVDDNRHCSDTRKGTVTGRKL